MHAREVVAAIVGAGPLVADHWSVAGYGSADPAAPNDKDENKKKNRRVEITMLADDAPAL
jgi:flagellar motor protein MotB